MIYYSLRKLKINYFYHKEFSTSIRTDQLSHTKFEPVFSLSLIKYIALINRAKIYHGVGSCVFVPTSGLLEMFNILSENTFLTTTYIGITGAIVLSAASLPFRDTIGFLYISEDNRHIKISAVDFWGRRTDKIIATDDWLPLSEMTPKTLDALYLTPTLSDGTKYKLFLKFGSILNSRKIGEVLE